MSHPWITGPALELIIKTKALRPGDFVLSRHAKDVSIVIDGIAGDGTYVFLNPYSGIGRAHRSRAYAFGIRAWQRPPLDIEL